MKRKDNDKFDSLIKEVIDFFKEFDKTFKLLGLPTSEVTKCEKETVQIEGLYNFYQFIKTLPSDTVSENAADFFSLMSTLSTPCSNLSDKDIQSQFDAFETALAGQTE